MESPPLVEEGRFGSIAIYRVPQQARPSGAAFSHFPNFRNAYTFLPRGFNPCGAKIYFFIILLAI